MFQVLECRVCNNVFGQKGDKTPRLLSCGHTLCHSCLSRLPNINEASNSDENVEQLHEIQCPFDRQPSTLGPNGVWDLKKNFALLELLEKLEDEVNDRRAVVLFTEASLERERELLVCCDENEEHRAVVYCTTCATHLCQQVSLKD